MGGCATIGPWGDPCHESHLAFGASSCSFLFRVDLSGSQTQAFRTPGCLRSSSCQNKPGLCLSKYALNKNSKTVNCNLQRRPWWIGGLQYALEGLISGCQRAGSTDEPSARVFDSYYNPAPLSRPHICTFIHPQDMDPIYYIR